MQRGHVSETRQTWYRFEAIVDDGVDEYVLDFECPFPGRLQARSWLRQHFITLQFLQWRTGVKQAVPVARSFPDTRVAVWQISPRYPEYFAVWQHPITGAWHSVWEDDPFWAFANMSYDGVRNAAIARLEHCLAIQTAQPMLSF